MILFLKALWCCLAHKSSYFPLPSEDKDGRKGVYCLKCKASFTVTQSVFKRLKLD